MNSPARPLAPTGPRERLGGLDLLRGFALCGILVINMRYFAMPMAGRALGNPKLPGGEFAAADFWSWFGDILTLYALCGMVVVWFRRLPPSILVVLGLSSVFLSIGERPFKGMLAKSAPLERMAEAPAAETAAKTGLLARRQELQKRWQESFVEHFEANNEAGMHRGSWWGQVMWRSTLVLWWQGAGFLLNGLFWNGGLMLVGMGLMGLGFLSGKLRAGSYLGLGFAAMAIGLALSALGLWPLALGPRGRAASMGQPGEGPPTEAFLRYVKLADAVRGLGVLLVCFGWTSLLLKPLEAVGRMALTNYLTHTVVCILVFEGWAFGHWFEMRYFEQMKLVGIILAVQLVVCPLWLAVCRFGPMEWLWRSLTYWQRQPMRKMPRLPGQAAHRLANSLLSSAFRAVHPDPPESRPRLSHARANPLPAPFRPLPGLPGHRPAP